MTVVMKMKLCYEITSNLSTFRWMREEEEKGGGEF